jgi:7-keto-8-aminopelargonate synthetase-like enzyme
VPSSAVPNVSAQPIEAVELLSAFHRCFKGKDAELNHVDFELLQSGSDLMRRTTIRRDGVVQKVSDMVPIRRA